jgi:hypothetical protein
MVDKYETEGSYQFIDGLTEGAKMPNLAPLPNGLDAMFSAAEKTHDRLAAEVPKTPIPGKVLKVIKAAKFDPNGPRARLNKISNVKETTCLKIIVRTDLDRALPYPCNFINPGTEAQFIDWHYVYEAVNNKADKDIPKVGDYVSVIYPWAVGGWRATVGLYVGKIQGDFPPACLSTMAKFEKNKAKAKSGTSEEPGSECGREKIVPTRLTPVGVEMA